MKNVMTVEPIDRYSSMGRIMREEVEYDFHVPLVQDGTVAYRIILVQSTQMNNEYRTNVMMEQEIPATGHDVRNGPPRRNGKYHNLSSHDGYQTGITNHKTFPTRARTCGTYVLSLV
jgi:hypothetical protein